MRKKHRAVLQRVFEKPTPSGVRWADIVAMVEANGIEVVQHSGSRVLFRKGSERINLHAPHGPETGRETVRDIVAFLKALGVEP